MKKGKIIALILAGIAAVFLFLLLGKSKNEEGGKIVVVASADIKAGNKISEKELAIETVPDQYVLEGSASKIMDVAGKIAGVDIKKGEQITSNKAISPGDSGAGLAYQIPAGKRAISFRISDESSLDGNLKPGNRVDVAISMLTVAPGSSVKLKVGQEADLEAITGFMSKYLVENVEVLYVGADTIEDGTVSISGNGGDAAKGSSSILILAVTPEEALLLNTEIYQTDLKLGKLSVTLRPYDDDSKANPGQVSIRLMQ